jgi:hypothetical protein
MGSHATTASSGNLFHLAEGDRPTLSSVYMREGVLRRWESFEHEYLRLQVCRWWIDLPVSLCSVYMRFGD